MKDEQKSKEQLLAELRVLRERVACLEQEAQNYKHAAEEQKRLTALLDATPDFVGIANLNGRAFYLNRAARRLAGLTDHEPAGKMVIFDYHPEWVRRLLSEVLPIVLRDGVWCGETAMLTHDGREIPVSQLLMAHRSTPEGPIEFFSTIARDISKQKLAEAELRAAKEYAETLIQSSNDMIISADAERKIIEFNPAAERTFGYSKAEVLGRPVDILYADAEKHAPMRDLLTREGRYTTEVLNRRKDGTVFPSSVSASVLRDAEGKIVGMMGISRDITERKALERQRADFVAMLTHDIKNPLASILGYVDLLTEETIDRRTPEEDDFLQRLKDNVLTINSLIGNYLDLAKVEAGQLVLHKTPESLSELLRLVVNLHGGVVRRHCLSLVVEIAPNLPTVNVDRNAVERVFTNLLRNAIKFTPETGKIEIRMFHRVEDNAVVTEIRDTGPGIAPQDMPFLFERFRRISTTRRYEGTGLGLFIVKTFVEAHGGWVEVDGNWGQGACFRVILPAAVEPSFNPSEDHWTEKLLD
ncbi:MAG TPA: PAS domain S-box protein [Methylomirabilota bacterium]|nr:PAS domain S-box protein [Methylomirabilota bacterium]